MAFANKVSDASFTFTATTSSPDLTAAFARYQSIFFPRRSINPPGAGALAGVTVTVANVSGILQLETDESYVLYIPASGGKVSCLAILFLGKCIYTHFLSSLGHHHC